MKMSRESEILAAAANQDSQIYADDNGPPGVNEPAMLFCPVCDQRLEQSRCKLVCSRCGYFMSCADYY